MCHQRFPSIFMSESCLEFGRLAVDGIWLWHDAGGSISWSKNSIALLPFGWLALGNSISLLPFGPGITLLQQGTQSISPSSGCGLGKFSTVVLVLCSVVGFHVWLKAYRAGPGRQGASLISEPWLNPENNLNCQRWGMGAGQKKKEWRMRERKVSSVC